MASKTTPPHDDAPEQGKRYGPHHKAFSWLWNSEPDHRAEFVALTYDVARGVETVFDIVMNTQLHQVLYEDDRTDPDGRPLFSKGDTERLVRLALASARMLGDEADIVINDINRRNSKGGK